MIGNNVPAAFAPIEVKTGPIGSPFATKTLLGWIVWGITRKGKLVKMVNSSNYTFADIHLEKLYRQSLDYDFPEKAAEDKREWSWEDRRFVKIMNESCILINGHYQVDLPLRDPELKLPNNKKMAEDRLKSLMKKMIRIPQFKDDYVACMEDMISKGHAEEVSKQDANDGQEWYIPHHGVYHPRKPEKIRVVFDCAAKYRGTSLNDNLLPGPNLMNSLQGVLMRFRKFSVAFSSDIECMFYQVKVPDKQRDLLRFLWWQDGDITQKPRIYRKTVHLFGAASSPSCANYGLKRAALDNKSNVSKEAVDTVNQNFYMDDVLKSTESVAEAIKLVTELKTVCSDGGFNLTKWSCNRREVLEEIVTEHRSKELRNLDLDSAQLPVERTLGILWNPEDDVFQFQCDLKQIATSRRTMLSMASSIYDPLGFIAPLIIPAKIILQQMCRQKTGWDCQPDKEILVRWEQWTKNITDLKGIKITRCFVPDNFGKVVKRELHAFSDARELGYGIVIYIRSVNKRGDFYCSLVFAKARVAPLKKITIPRLELAAATLSVRLVTMVKRELHFQIDRVMFWTDSTPVLRYISNDRARYHTFVANRIQVIREVTVPAQWRYVGTKTNPADLASRGISKTQDLIDSVWFSGPEFLWQNDSEWRQDVFNTDIEFGDPEVKASCAVIEADDFSTVDRLASRISSWKKILKVMAWILLAKCKFMEMIRLSSIPNPSKDHQLTRKLLEESEIEIMKAIQERTYPAEIKALKKENLVSKKSQLFKYSPVLLSDGLIRIGGRIHKAEVSYDMRHPVVLTKQSPFAELILRDAHQKVGHLGKNAMLAKVREKYWVFGANQLAKRITRECIICRKHHAKPCEQVMADLPECRLKADGAPFENTGMDYFGPFLVKRGRSQVKRYGILFTCMSSRAVHLEIAHSLETDACINAIRRFMARKGPVKSITSDNGTNIVGAEKELREMINKLNQTRMNNVLCNYGIQWHFNPPSASHFGGVWERMIRSTRKILFCLMKEQACKEDDETLSTVFCEAENILNSRPLTVTSTDPNDLLPITPNMLINPRGISLETPGVFQKSDSYARRRWRHAQYLVDVFWSRWKKEYLRTLQKRTKWQRQRRNVTVRDIVLIVDTAVPRNRWLLGVVEAVFRDNKGNVRVCRVRTKSGVLERPIAKLCVIVEVKDSE